jgi:hypothetical protein
LHDTISKHPSKTTKTLNNLLKLSKNSRKTLKKLSRNPQKTHIKPLKKSQKTQRKSAHPPETKMVLGNF